MAGLGGADTLIGGEGTDTAEYLASANGVTVDLSTGLGTGGDAEGDRLTGIENLTGSNQADRLIGDGGDNRLDGAAGDDTLIGGEGADTLVGGAGIDTADYSASADAVVVDLAAGTGSGGTAEGDRLSGVENLIGSAFDDRLTGDGLDNVLKGGAGADTLEGGAGADTADYSGSDAGVTVDLTTGTGLGGDAEGDRLTIIENLSGSGHADLLIGDGGANRLDGAAGDDTLIAGAGADTLVGGAGTDTADYSASTAGVTVDLAAGTGSGGDAEGDRLSGVETVIATGQADSLTGDGADNYLDGRGGADALAGGAGNDTLRVLDEGFVSVDGGSGDDTLRFEGNRLMLLGTAVNVHGIERFDLTAEGHQTLIFNEQGVRANVGGAPLYVTGDRDDFVTFKESGWRRVGTLTEDGVLYNSYRRGDSVVNVQDGVRMFGDLVLTGTPGDDVITTPSGAGHVVVFGEGGNDIVRLGAGLPARDRASGAHRRRPAHPVRRGRRPGGRGRLRPRPRHHHGAFRRQRRGGGGHRQHPGVRLRGRRGLAGVGRHPADGRRGRRHHRHRTGLHQPHGPCRRRDERHPLRRRRDRRRPAPVAPRRRSGDPHRRDRPLGDRLQPLLRRRSGRGRQRRHSGHRTGRRHRLAGERRRHRHQHHRQRHHRVRPRGWGGDALRQRGRRHHQFRADHRPRPDAADP
ncbi:protein of unknown function (plasmid) [Azospirillum baldaniorum]|uniref:Calcium-binding protein n=1 Tax=Azospirillum baldaniorum TaxID=1064539 RepID=A0A9P1JWE3_9PROT|nr:protein of unknown function [Azospirillum baldaniorum]